MMKIKMLTTDVTATGCFYPGNIRKVSDAEGKSLIEAKAAVLIEEIKKAEPKEKKEDKKSKGENKLAPASEDKAESEEKGK